MDSDEHIPSGRGGPSREGLFGCAYTQGAQCIADLAHGDSGMLGRRRAQYPRARERAAAQYHGLRIGQRVAVARFCGPLGEFGP